MTYAMLCERFIGELLQEPSAFGCAVLLGMQTHQDSLVAPYFSAGWKSPRAT